jgi:hypothetical protein
MAQHPARAPLAGPQAPTMLGAQPLNLANMMPTTIPGQGSPMPPMASPMAPTMMPMPAMQPQNLHPMYAGYPQATEIPPHSVHAQMLVVQSQNRRGDLSTAHVPPTPYANGLAAPMAARFAAPSQMSKRTKYLLGGAGLALFAAVATIAIIKSGKKTQPVTTQDAGSGSAKLEAKQDPKLAKVEGPKPDAIETKLDPKPDPKLDPKNEKKIEAKVEPKPDPKPDPKPEQKKIEPKVEPKQDPKNEKKIEAKAEPKPDPKTKKPDQKKEIKKVEPKLEIKKPDPKPEPDPRPRVAGPDSDAIKDQADALYRNKKFNEASNMLKSLAKTDTANARALNSKAGAYALLGRAYNRGMAPGGSPIDTFEQLRTASTYDQNLGNAFEGEIAAKMTQVAPKAAVQFVSAGKLVEAHQAVQAADQVGAGGDANVKAVRQKLESEAGKIYAQAMKELDGNPSEAKDKLKQIKGIVDSKSPWFVKATKQLSGA